MLKSVHVMIKIKVKLSVDIEILNQHLLCYQLTLTGNVASINMEASLVVQSQLQSFPSLLEVLQVLTMYRLFTSDSNIATNL